MSASSPAHNILITGASGDIGRALSLAYAAPGITLMLTGRDPDRLQQVTEQARERGARVLSEALDVTQTQPLMAWVSRMDHQYPLDLVIANAGMTSHLQGSEDGEAWETIECLLQTNLMGSLATITPLVSTMRQRGRGQIALISSLSAWYGLPLTPSYCASKAALKAYGEALQGWLAPQGVAVSVVLPGFVRSAMSDRFPGPKPFMLDAEQAAAKIRRGLQRRRPRISFPFPLNLGMWSLAVLPAGLSSRILRWLDYGG